MTAVPKRIKVGAVVVSIEPQALLPTDYGRSHIHQAKILVDPDQSPQLMPDTVLHELLHFAVFLSGASRIEGWSELLEERLVSCLTPALLQIVRDNPAVVQYLTEKP